MTVVRFVCPGCNELLGGVELGTAKLGYTVTFEHACSSDHLSRVTVNLFPKSSRAQSDQR